jgi:ubiquinone/menaquinone biosynthesis C-methylase UbiE
MDMTTVNFDALPAAGHPDAELLATRLASYAAESAFATSRAWSRGQVADAQRVLEVGPGLGDSTEALAAAGVDVTWVDASAHFAAAAASHSPGAISDVTGLAFRDGAFGAVLCDRVLHHVVGIDAALRELRRVITDGGALVLTLPDLSGQTSDAPVGPWRDYVSSVVEVGGFTARPDAYDVIVAGIDGFEFVSEVRFALEPAELIVDYARPVERTLDARSRGSIGEESADAMLEWFDRDDKVWALDIVGLRLRAV